jgi:large subunit ribosomal protein L17
MHRHANKGYKFSRNKGPRELMLRNLTTSVILHEKVKTTSIKAKGVQPTVEKMITLAKKGDLNSIRSIDSYLLDEQAGKKLVVELAPLYKDRKGGYTRIIKFGSRAGDNAKMSIIELLDVEKLNRKVKEKKVKSEKSKETEEKPKKVAKSQPKKAKKETK